MQKCIIEFKFKSDLLDDEIHSTATAKRLPTSPLPFVHFYKLFNTFYTSVIYLTAKMIQC